MKRSLIPAHQASNLHPVTVAKNVVDNMNYSPESMFNLATVSKASPEIRRAMFEKASQGLAPNQKNTAAFKKVQDFFRNL